MGALGLLSSKLAANDVFTDRKIKASVDVIVIGAGMAGIAAAKYLRAKRVQVKVLEARDRIGGRIWTDRSLGAPLDMGASWIHGIKGNPISTLAKKFKVQTSVTNYENFAVYDDNGVQPAASNVTAVAARYNKLYQNVLDLKGTLARDVSLEDAFAKVLQKEVFTPADLDQFHWLQAAEISGNAAADLDELSLFSYGEDGQFKGSDALFPGGYDQIVNALATDVSIDLNQVVQKITYDNANVTVATDQGVYLANAVIVTLPLGVLQSEKVEFHPALPDYKLKSIKRMGMGLLNKLAMVFPEPFWPTDKDFIGHIPAAFNEFPEFLSTFKYNQMPVLSAANTGSFARALETKTDDEAAQDMLAVLRGMYGASVPDPVDYSVTRWGSDPYSMGSYSYLPVGASVQDYINLSVPVQSVVFFAGEATHDKYPNTVHGAYLSGIREAKNVLKALSGP